MKVQCITINANELPDILFIEDFPYSKSDFFPMEMGKIYTVYAMILAMGYVWYGICDDNFNNPLEFIPGLLFKVSDSKISKYWVFAYSPEMNTRKVKAIWAYPEWAKDLDYYEKLQKKDFIVLATFNAFKSKIDNE